MIKGLSRVYKGEVLKIFNHLFQKGEIPDLWRKYQVHFIDKPGKAKVRPISLSSCFGKVLERMLNERLIWWAETNDRIDSSQNGFRKGKSCIENLVQIVADIRGAMYEKEKAVAALLDISSAYDNVDYKCVIEKLNKLQCPSKITRFIEAWLSYREVQFVGGEKEINRNVYEGLPQGALLSPILYTLYTSEIMKDIDEDIDRLQFADDIAVYAIGKNNSENRRKITAAVEIITDRLRELGLELAPNKTTLVEFNKKGEISEESYINQNEHVCIGEEKVKFLGVWLV